MRRMDRALAQYVILGLTTNIAFLRGVLAHPVFQRGEATTAFIERELSNWKPRLDGEMSNLASIAVAMNELAASQDERRTTNGEGQAPAAYDPWLANDGFRIGGRE
ncbi:MAG: hypothetical protein ACRD2A_23985 [Vicinamibacterales bacterium]